MGNPIIIGPDISCRCDPSLVGGEVRDAWTKDGWIHVRVRFKCSCCGKKWWATYSGLERKNVEADNG